MSSGPAQLKVLFAETHELVLAGYRQLMGGLHARAWYVDRHQDAVRTFVEQQPDVVVLDVELAPQSGWHTAAAILERDSRAYILLVADRLSQAQLRQGASMGIAGFISRATTIAEFLHALKQVSSGEGYTDSRFTRSNGHGAAQALEKLSAREYEVFLKLAAGQSTGDIAGDLDISLKTVANYATRLKRKLHVRSTAGLTLLAVRSQLIDL